MSKKTAAEYLTGKLLLAMPSLGDSRFDHAVILMCAHDENGAMGLVINHTLEDVKFENLLEELGIKSDIKLDPKSLSIPVLSGGPVDHARGFLLHSNDFVHKETISIDERYHVTGTIDALQAVAKGKGPDNMLFILGYAGWTAGQIEREIQDNAWLVVEPDETLIFGVDPAQKWQSAVQKLGFDPAMLTGDAGQA